MDYYLINAKGDQDGPYKTEELRTLLRSGHITLDTLMWTDGMAEWQPLRVIEDTIRPIPTEQVAPTTLPSGMPAKPILGNASIIETLDDQSADVESPAACPHFEEIARSPFITGASASCTSKIIMGIESLNRDEYERALNLFQACLEENHTIASGWLGTAYAEAMLVSVERHTLENIQNAVSKAHQFCPSTQRIDDHHGIVLTLGFHEASLMASSVYSNYLVTLLSAQRSVLEGEIASGNRTTAIALGVGAAVLGGFSGGILGKIVGYGVAAGQTHRAIDAHTATNQTQMDAQENQQRSDNYFQLAKAFSTLIQNFIPEIQRVCLRCSPDVQVTVTNQFEEDYKKLIPIQDTLMKTWADLGWSE